jgi:glycosidase
MPLAPGHDRANVTAQARDPGSLLSRYRDLIRVRKASPALRRGDLQLLRSDPGVLAFVRRSGGEAVLVVHNLSGERGGAGPISMPEQRAEALLVDPGATIFRDAYSWNVSVLPGATAIWRLR